MSWDISQSQKKITSVKTVEAYISVQTRQRHQTKNFQIFGEQSELLCRVLPFSGGRYLLLLHFTELMKRGSAPYAVVLEPNVGERVMRFTPLHRTGLLIGRWQRSEGIVRVWWAAATPPQPNTLPSNSSSDGPDENWILEHAHQVNRMLCGENMVVGMYLFSESKDMQKRYETSWEFICRGISHLHTSSLDNSSSSAGGQSGALFLRIWKSARGPENRLECANSLRFSLSLFPAHFTITARHG